VISSREGLEYSHIHRASGYENGGGDEGGGGDRWSEDMHVDDNDCLAP
jgi:hypothetical protein